MNWRSYAHIYLIGNGGSYANAIHIANDFLMVGLKAHTLDPASLTRTANDASYAEEFAEWLSVVAEPNDLIIGLSGSGRSENIRRAFDVAKAKGATTLGVFGDYNDAQIPCDILKRGGYTMQQAEQYQLEWAHEVMLSLRK